MKKIYLVENTIKNVLVLIVMLLMYGQIVNFFKGIASEHYGNILLTVSIIIMAFLFADYAFTFSNSNLKNVLERYYGYLVTFIIMLGTGILLEIVVIVLNLEVGLNVWPFTFIAILFYFSLMLYDFWDLLRNREAAKK